jgi:galactofuranosylgalactofuranosylrhamnosyl-N-acetylglucosaminyl-diphospho-decaprenol beta-1,5/1,6-galactofuranosyltransferase
MSTQVTEATVAAAADAGLELRVLQRVILPLDRDMDVLPLYVDYSTSAGSAGEIVEETAVTVDVLGQARHPEHILSRRRLRVLANQRVSFATYFNGFAASYWRMWSVVENVLLHIRVSGSATVIVYRSTADGRSQRIDSATTESDSGGSFEFELPLKPFGDGGWYWFDISAGARGAVLEEASWDAYVPAERLRHGSATIGLTVIRPETSVPLLAQLAADAEVMAALDEVLVVDQGTNRVRDEADLARIEASMAGKLRIIEQGNIGGSGGFARAQYETLVAGVSDYVLLLDDDIVAEPECVLRAITFGDLARRPTIVGAHMFSLYSRSQLHSFGERINWWRFWWDAAPGVRTQYDLATHNLRRTPWLHKRIDVDFNGWWMCLIPRAVIEEIGLSLPLFIKWDDAEYGVRASAAGFPTVSMPGVGVWHVPWTDKNDALDWQAYFHQRNRTVAALLHSPYAFGGRMVRESFNHQVKHLLAMQYSTAELRLLAIEDVLRGPEHLHPSISTRLADVRAIRAGFPDAQAKPHSDSFPQVRLAKPPRRGGRDEGVRETQLTQIKLAAIGGLRQFRPVRQLATKHPEVRLAAAEARWYALSARDSAIVSTTDGTGASWYRRSPREFRRLLARSVAVHQELAREWPRVAKAYRRALEEIASPSAWEKTFDAARPAGPEDGTS